MAEADGGDIGCAVFFILGLALVAWLVVDVLPDWWEHRRLYNRCVSELAWSEKTPYLHEWQVEIICDEIADQRQEDASRDE